MRHSVAALLALTLVACSPSQAANPDGDAAVAEAKAVIASHEAYAAAGDLDGVLSNVADDVVLLAGGSPLVEGADAVRAFYVDLFSMGTWEFGHDYRGAEVVGDAVVLHGVARGTLTPAEGEPSSFANNFILVLKPGEHGAPKVWRVAFAPAAP